MSSVCCAKGNLSTILRHHSLPTSAFNLPKLLCINIPFRLCGRLASSFFSLTRQAHRQFTTSSRAFVAFKLIYGLHQNCISINIAQRIHKFIAFHFTYLSSLPFFAHFVSFSLSGFSLLSQIALSLFAFFPLTRQSVMVLHSSLFSSYMKPELYDTLSQ